MYSIHCIFRHYSTIIFLVMKFCRFILPYIPYTFTFSMLFFGILSSIERYYKSYINLLLCDQAFYPSFASFHIIMFYMGNYLMNFYASRSKHIVPFSRYLNSSESTIAEKNTFCTHAYYTRIRSEITKVS
jgi:hypothetical protein